MKKILDLVNLTNEFYKKSLWNYFLIKTAAEDESQNTEISAEDIAKIKKIIEEKKEKLKPLLEECNKNVKKIREMSDGIINDKLYAAIADSEDESSLLTSYKGVIACAKNFITRSIVDRNDLNDKVYNFAASREGINTELSMLSEKDIADENLNFEEFKQLFDDVISTSGKILKILLGESVGISEFIKGESENTLQGQLSGASPDFGTSDKGLEWAEKIKQSRRNAAKKFINSRRLLSRIPESHKLYGSDVHTRAIALFEKIKESKRRYYDALKSDPEKYEKYLENKRKQKFGIEELENQIANLKTEMRHARPDEEEELRQKIIRIEKRIKNMKEYNAALTQKRKDIREGKFGQLSKILGALRLYIAAARMSEKDKFYDPIVSRIVSQYQNEEYSAYRSLVEKLSAAKAKFDDLKSRKGSVKKDEFDAAKKLLETETKNLKKVLYRDMESDFQEYIKDFEKIYGGELFDLVKDIQDNKLEILNEVGNMVIEDPESLDEESRSKIEKAEEFIDEINRRIEELKPLIRGKSQEHLESIQEALADISNKISIV